jgi:hypothetical protein
MCLCHRDSERPEGFWLYDADAGHNLAMGAPTEIEALVQAVQYWKQRAKQAEKEHTELRTYVDQFVQLVSPLPEDDG